MNQEKRGARAQATRIEARWPVALAIVALTALLGVLPERLTVLPTWFPYVAGAVVLAPIIAVALTARAARWHRIERAVTILYIAIGAVLTLVTLANLIGAMVHRSAELSGLSLLASSIGVWVTNVTIFSLLYWEIDRGGPEARQNNAGTMPDWLFPQTGASVEDVPADWRPVFVDYLFLGYSTATAFSTTDVMPLTSRAKLLMMLESAISLATIVAVAARAINILGG